MYYVKQISFGCRLGSSKPEKVGVFCYSCYTQHTTTTHFGQSENITLPTPICPTVGILKILVKLHKFLWFRSLCNLSQATFHVNVHSFKG